MGRGTRKGAQTPLALEDKPAMPDADLATATSVRFTRDFTCNIYGAPYSFYKAGTVISNVYMIGLLRKANAPIEAV